ncbi:cytochrome P450 CYP12A2-like [Glossina fuscipes]|uniref:Cytochrome P450 CYP12A2-like n=1 Tax=Glossina fuscipes TaxID=7396 RepID=A0A9C5ZH47_9MUSC|nr:cytochrome P450 CYP12A2-like [Glossina fuscipes]
MHATRGSTTLEVPLGLVNEKRKSSQANKLLVALNEFFSSSYEIEDRPSLWKYIHNPTFKRFIKALDAQQDITTKFINEDELLYRNEHYHGNASEYLPRWLRSQQTNENVNVLKASSPIVFLPFGFAPRNCVGRRVVSMELQLGVARLIRNFEVEFHCSTENAFGNIQLIVPNIPLRFQFIDCEM